jgi:putative transposase
MGSKEPTMPRAKRHYEPGYVWHLTHRCHNREYLLKFEKDRARWRHWLFEARKRYGLSVLTYIATSNHIHLLVRDMGNSCISKSMQLVAGRLAQEYNKRKLRRGAFWEDRYFATAVATDRHLTMCLVYIDLNMVRAGVVDHPSQWKVSGFNEIQSSRARYRIVDIDALCALTGSSSAESFREMHQTWIEHELARGSLVRQPEWTESIAVGPEDFKSRFQH